MAMVILRSACLGEMARRGSHPTRDQLNKSFLPLSAGASAISRWTHTVQLCLDERGLPDRMPESLVITVGRSVLSRGVPYVPNPQSTSMERSHVHKSDRAGRPALCRSRARTRRSQVHAG